MKCMHGLGVYKNQTGSRYQGIFKSNKPNGYGLYTSENGQSYKGNFKMGSLSGEGIMIYPDGRRYEGNFKENEHNGFGIMEYPSGDVYGEGSKYAGQWNVGDSLIIENGLIKMVLGTSTTQSKFKTYIWDETAYSTEQEWAFSLGDPISGSHLGTEYDGWHRVQILTNRPEVVVVRCTTFKDTDKSSLTA